MSAHPDKVEKWKSDVYVDSSFHCTTHYHPDFIDLIVGELSKREYAPEGWKTMKGLITLIQGKRCCCSESTIKDI